MAVRVEHGGRVTGRVWGSNKGREGDSDGVREQHREGR